MDEIMRLKVLVWKSESSEGSKRSIGEAGGEMEPVLNRITPAHLIV
jgi:hypothetical protein